MKVGMTSHFSYLIYMLISKDSQIFVAATLILATEADVHVLAVIGTL